MKILRINAVCERTGLSRSSIYKQMREGNFPKSIYITKGAKGWPEPVVDQWNESKVSNTEVYGEQPNVLIEPTFLK